MLEKSEQWQLALNSGADVRGSLAPDVITYNAAMSAFGKGAQGQQALELMLLMHEYELVPDVITYNAAISVREG